MWEAKSGTQQKWDKDYWLLFQAPRKTQFLGYEHSPRPRMAMNFPPLLPPPPPPKKKYGVSTPFLAVLPYKASTFSWKTRSGKDSKQSKREILKQWAFPLLDLEGDPSLVTVGTLVSARPNTMRAADRTAVAKHRAHSCRKILSITRSSHRGM